MYQSRVGTCRSGVGQYNWWQASEPGAYETTDPTVPEEVEDWIELGQRTLSIYEKISGISHCWRGYGNRPNKEPCPNTPNYDAVIRAVRRGPQTDIDQIITYLLQGNDGRGPKSRAELADPKCVPFWTKAILGGKGCVNSRFPEAPDWFRAFVRAYGAPQDPTEYYPGSSIPETVKQGAANLAPIVAAGLAVILLPRILG